MTLDAERHIDFISPGVYPGEALSEDEALLAASEFEALKTGLFAEYADFVDVRVGDDMGIVSLRLSIESRDGSAVWVDVMNILQPRHAIRQIVILVKNPEGRAVSDYAYSLNEEGTRVVRRDTPDIAALSAGIDFAKFHEGEQAAVDAVEQVYLNSEFELEMGVNEQPVGMKDMQELRRLLLKATPRQVL